MPMRTGGKDLWNGWVLRQMYRTLCLPLITFSDFTVTVGIDFGNFWTFSISYWNRRKPVWNFI